MPDSPPEISCPDSGRCWHDCPANYCWRVQFAGPFSNTYLDDEWPVSIRGNRGVRL